MSIMYDQLIISLQEIATFHLPVENIRYSHIGGTLEIKDEEAGSLKHDYLP